VATTPFKRPLTAQEAVLDELRRKIRSGQWSPGTPIRQDAIAAELGVSRVPVREALKLLEGEGQVTYLPHKGYVVTKLDASELKEIYRMRQILETEAATQAVPRLTDADLERMRDAMESMESAAETDVIQLMEENRRFHLTLFEASDMPRLVHFIRLLRDSADTYRAMIYTDDETRGQANREHRRIYEACEEGAVDRVIELLNDHRGHTVGVAEAVIGAADRLADAGGQEAEPLVGP
jgi:DNA-binding GntR family transcriptional regulator